MNRTLLATLTFLIIFSGPVAPSSYAVTDTNILTKDQESWLSNNNRTIVVRPEKNYPPFVFSTSSGKNTLIQGLGIDYLELIASKTKAKIQYLEPSQLSNILTSAKNNEGGVIVALTKTTDRDKYLNFTKPFISVPAVIVLRKDNLVKNKDLTLAEFSGKVVAVGKSYAVESFIKNNYSKVNISEVPDDEVGLQKLLLGEVDAAVMDIASLSYFTSNKALSYVAIAGQTGFDYDLSFAAPNSSSEMLGILDSALEALTPEEKATIREKWITFTPSNEAPVSQNIFGNLNFTVVIIFIVLSLALIVIIIFLIRSYKRTQSMFFQDLKKTPENHKTLKQDLKELENARDIITEELSHIKEIEEDIEEKIGKKD